MIDENITTCLNKRGLNDMYNSVENIIQAIDVPRSLTLASYSSKNTTQAVHVPKSSYSPTQAVDKLIPKASFHSKNGHFSRYDQSRR